MAPFLLLYATLMAALVHSDEYCKWKVAMYLLCNKHSIQS